MQLRAWHMALIALVAFAALRFGWSEPRFISAEEADTVQAGVDLVTALTADGEQGVKERLKLGFETDEAHPRLDDFPPDQPHRRAVLEAPVPRWLAALGIGVLGGEETPNMQRAGTAAALAVALGLLLMMWLARGLGWAALLGPALLVCLPGVLDASVGAGYGAASIVVMAGLALAVERLAASGRGALLVGLGCGLAFGIHPMGIALVVAVFVAYAIAQRGPSEAGDGVAFTLPRAPVGLFVVPIVALIVLVAVWPALWNETGKRLGSWLLDYGFYFNTPYDVLGQTYHQHHDRAAPAWTALLQWAAWTPVPIAALWVAGVWRAVRAGRAGKWFPIVAWLTLLLCGAMDGGLFGARWSLLPLLWVPTALTAADGLMGVAAWLRERWASPMRYAVLAVPVAISVWQAVHVTTWGAASETGSELRYPVSLRLVDEVEAAEPGAVVALLQGPTGEYLPQLEAARVHLERDVRVGEAGNAGWIVVIGDRKPESDRALRGFSEVKTDRRAGIPMSLWRRDRP